MIHRALKRTPRWLQPLNLRALRRPLPWLIALALALLVGGVGTIARIGLFLASPETFRYASEIVSGNAANYGFWALGPLIPPINPDAIEEAAAAEQTPPQPAGPAGPQNPVPIAVVGAPTESPASPTAAPPSPEPSPQLLPSPTPTATRPLPPAAPPSPPPSRTAAAVRVPTTAPISIVRPTSTPVVPSSTPVTRPEVPPPAATGTPPPTATTAPTTPPGPTRTAPPVQPAPTTPPTPSPTSTPSPTPAPQEPPLLSFAVAARTVSEDDGRVEVELKLSKAFDKIVTARYATEAGTAKADEDYRSSSGTITFEPGTLSRTLTVPIMKDEQDEPNERFTIRLLDAENATLTAPDAVLVTITDTTAPPKVSFAGTGRTVSESDGTAAATIQLSAPSAIDVTVPYTVLGSADANDHSLRPGTVIIPAGSTSARLRFAIVDDRIDEDDETVRIDLGTPTDAQSGPPSVYVVTITDNDTAGVSVAPTQLNLAEKGPDATYSVVLESQPVAPVTIAVGSEDGQLTAAPARLTFTAQNWDTPQEVSVRAVDDDVDEPNVHPGRLTHVVTSADPNYDGFDAAPLSARIADDDTAGVLITLPDLKLAEGGAAASYSVRLTSQPTAAVTIDLAPDTQVTTSRAALTFTPATWSTAQVVNVAAVDDAIDEDGDGNVTAHQGVVRHSVSSPDPLYNGLDADAVTAAIVDNDTAGVLLSKTTLALSEAVTAGNHVDSYTIRLTSQPTAAVTIDVAPDGQVTASPARLTFTASDWNTPQAVAVTAVDDPDIEANPHTGIITHAAMSGDPLYNGRLVDPVTANIVDNDTAGIRRPDTPTVAEGGASVPYGLRLTSRPTNTVTVTLTPDAQVGVSPTTLTFTPSTWDITQTVTISATDDFVAEASPHAGTVRYSFASADANYNGLVVPPTQVNITDNDTAALLITPTSLSVDELITAPGRSVIYVVRLGSEPTAPVTISLSFDVTQLAVSPSSVTFNRTNWNIQQTISVAAVDDVLNEGTMTRPITHTVASADTLYAAFSGATATVTIVDDDFAGVTFVPATLMLSESAAGANPTSGTVAFALRSQPTAPVTVTLAPDAQIQAGPATLLFTPASWNVPQNVTLAAVNDIVDEPATYSGTLALSLRSPDPYYDGRAVPPYTVTIEDDDTAGVVVSAASGAVTSESGGSVSFDVRLASQPLAPVSLVVRTSSPEAAVSSPAMPILFSEATWDTPVTVTITGRDDPDYDGLVPFAVTFSAAGDAAYEALTAAEFPSINLANADNEPAVVAIGDPARPMREGDSGFRALRFPVTLARPSTVPVTVSYETLDVSATGGDDYVEAASTLTFEPGDQSEMISIYLIGDEQYEADELFAVRLTGVSADSDAVALGKAEAVGRIRNDDRPAVHFAAADSFTDEGAGTVTLTVTLDAPITSTVTVSYATIDSGERAGTATAGVDYIGASGELTFAPGETTKRITLTILDDSTPDEPSETVRLSLFGASGAPIGTPGVATVTIAEDEGAPEPPPGDTGEGRAPVLP